MLYRVQLAGAGFELITLVVIDTDCIGSCKSNYHMITTATPPDLMECRAFLRIFLIRLMFYGPTI